MSKEQLEAQLFYLLQKIYFDSIDNSKADEAVEAMHPEVRWVIIKYGSMTDIKVR